MRDFSTLIINKIKCSDFLKIKIIRPKSTETKYLNINDTIKIMKKLEIVSDTLFEKKLQGDVIIEISKLFN